MEAIVLAGGKGTRLQSVVQDVPKPMAPIKGRPFLCFVLDELKLHGFNHIILSVGYMKDKIIEYFGSEFQGMKISYSVEDEPLGTGGGIKKALQLADQEDVFILNGDTIFKIDFTSLYASHCMDRPMLTIALKPMEDVDRYGLVLTKGDRIIKFLEKRYAKIGLINGGIYLLNKGQFDNLKLPEKFSFETDFMQRQYLEHDFKGFISKGYFIDIGIPEDYQKAQTDF